MIEDKDLGIKVAVNKDEAFLRQTLERAEADIKQSQNVIEINEWIIKGAKEKLEQVLKEIQKQGV